MKATLQIGAAEIGAVVFVVLLMATGDAWSRGGRGGGGGGRVGGGFSGGGGGLSRPSPSISRSPSMSRPSASRPSMPSASFPNTSRPAAGARPSVGTRPSTGARPSVGARPGTGARPGDGAAAARPSSRQLQNFLDIPSSGTARPGTFPSTRPSNVGGGAAADFLQGNRPATLPAGGQRPGVGERPGVGNRPGAGDRPLTQHRPDRIENRQQWQDNRLQRRDEVRHQVHDHHPRLDFWSNYPGWAAWRITRPYRWATWVSLTGWVGNAWSEPVVYSYGDNVYYEDNSVYYGDQVVATAEEYAEQAEAIVASAPEVAPENEEWMPLGVFALTQDGQWSGPDPSLFLQLAISKEGVIAGTLHNTATDSTQTIEGLADKKSQRCAWNVVGKTRPIMETGIGSLTEETAPALVHFADGQTQQWLMVRLEEPSAQP